MFVCNFAEGVFSYVIIFLSLVLAYDGLHKFFLFFIFFENIVLTTYVITS